MRKEPERETRLIVSQPDTGIARAAVAVVPNNYGGGG